MIRNQDILIHLLKGLSQNQDHQVVQDQRKKERRRKGEMKIGQETDRYKDRDNDRSFKKDKVIKSNHKRV